MNQSEAGRNRMWLSKGLQWRHAMYHGTVYPCGKYSIVEEETGLLQG